jgi:hypothetical protein
MDRSNALNGNILENIESRVNPPLVIILVGALVRLVGPTAAASCVLSHVNSAHDRIQPDHLQLAAK